jgi:hypothetical protein
MTKHINLGGEDRPVKFGFAALMNFTDMSGYKLNELDKLGDNMTLTDAVKLIYCGLKNGSRVERQKFNHQLEDVADWLDESPTAINEVLELFAQSFSNEEQGE